MAKIFQQIGLTPDNYQWLIEEKIGRHHKHLTETVNEILRNYQIMIKSVDKAREHAEKMEKARLEAEQLAKTYRSAVVITDAKA